MTLETWRLRWVLGLVLVAAPLASAGCAVTIPPGHAGVLVTTSGVAPGVVDEGVSWISPLSRVDIYDVRGQERSEDLQALAADGAPVEARASLVTYSLVRRELPALERQVGPRYYEVIVEPIVRASVRRVIGGYRSDQLTPDGIRAAQAQITALIARRLQPFHIVVESIDLRTLAFVLSAKSYGIVTDTGIAQQQALSAPALLTLAEGGAADRRAIAQGIVNANTLIAPDLSRHVLDDAAVRAWTTLVTAPSTNVVIRAADPAARVEITP